MIVDGNNVMGAAADGWWRDPSAAARRLLDRIVCYAATSGDAIELVFDVPQSDLPEGEYGGVHLRYATRRGRDAGDDRIVELLAAAEAIDVVVTSDRLLAERAADYGARVIGAGAFLSWLADANC